MKKTALIAATVLLASLPNRQTCAQAPASCENGAIVYSSGEAMGLVDLPDEVVRWHLEKFDELAQARQDFYCAVGSDTFAANRIARRYYQGFDTPPDTRDVTADKKAAAYYEFAANLGNLHAMAILSHLYYVGDGVKKDIGQSYYWAYLAHKLGHRYLRTAYYEIERLVPARLRFKMRTKANNWQPSQTSLKTVLQNRISP